MNIVRIVFRILQKDYVKQTTNVDTVITLFITLKIKNWAEQFWQIITRDYISERNLIIFVNFSRHRSFHWGAWGESRFSKSKFPSEINEVMTNEGFAESRKYVVFFTSSAVSMKETCQEVIPQLVWMCLESRSVRKSGRGSELAEALELQSKSLTAYRLS